MTANANTLPTALGFTAEDLEANRQGKLSHSQFERMKGIRRRNSVIASLIFVVLALSASVLFYLGQFNRSLILFGAGATLTVINAFMAGRAGQAYMQMGGDLRARQVEALSGEVERVLRRGRTSDFYLLQIDGAELKVPKDVFIGFRHKTPYHIYRAGISRVLLSAERVS